MEIQLYVLRTIINCMDSLDLIRGDLHDLRDFGQSLGTRFDSGSSGSSRPPLVPWKIGGWFHLA